MADGDVALALAGVLTLVSLLAGACIGCVVTAIILGGSRQECDCDFYETAEPPREPGPRSDNVLPYRK